MAKVDVRYHTLLEKILQEGYDYKDESRNVNCKQISSYEFRHNLQTDGFPAITTKKLYWKGVVGELIWFLRGDPDIRYLWDNNISIWDKDWANKVFSEYPAIPFKTIEEAKLYYKKDDKEASSHRYSLGPIYGKQWRNWVGLGKLGDYILTLFNSKKVDQISDLIKNLKEKPMSRRHLVTAWNPAELNNMALPPCHWAFEIIPRPLTVSERSIIYYSNIQSKEVFTLTNEVLNSLNIPKYTFDLKWHQRSVDIFLGLPFNIASYGLLAHIIGKLTNMIPNELIGDLSNVHIYEPHMKAVKEQLSRDVNKYSECKLDISKLIDIDIKKYPDNLDMFIGRLKIEDFNLIDYESFPTIKADMLTPN